MSTTTKERPILFNGEMVRGILDGRKTQTRRPATQPRVDKEGKEYLFERGAARLPPQAGV